MFWFLGSREFHYSRLKNVRVNRYSMKVERLYVVQLERHSNGRGRVIRKEWREVDYKTTHRLKDGCRPCPQESLKTLLQTAF